MPVSSLHLAGHALLQRLPGLHEPRQHAVHVGGKRLRPRQEDACVPHDGHDHRGGDPRVAEVSRRRCTPAPAHRASGPWGCRRRRRIGACGPTRRSPARARPRRRSSSDIVPKRLRTPSKFQPARLPRSGGARPERGTAVPSTVPIRWARSVGKPKGGKISISGKLDGLTVASHQEVGASEHEPAAKVRSPPHRSPLPGRIVRMKELAQGERSRIAISCKVNHNDTRWGLL